MMTRKTKATLENDILNLKRDINILTRQKKENEKPKPIYVVYPEKDWSDWHKNNKADIEKFHADENNFKYWQEQDNWRDDSFNKKWEELPSNDNLPRWHWFYIHGKLEEEVGYDICNINIPFPFDEQLPYNVLETREFIEGLGILYKVEAKLSNGKDVLIFAHCGLRCSIMNYLSNAMRNKFTFMHMAQQFGMLEPEIEGCKEEVWKLRDRDNNSAESLGFKPVYPIISHDWGYWKDHLKKYKLVKVRDGWLGNQYRLDNLSNDDKEDTRIHWQGRIIYADDKESFDHCMNPLEWS